MDTITKARQAYSQYSVDELTKQFKVPEIRKIARETGIKHVNRNGGLVSVNNARKNELVSAIFEACKVYSIAEQLQEIQPIKLTLNEGDFRKYEDMLDRLALGFYNGNTQVQKGLKQILNETFLDSLPFNPDMFELISVFRPMIEGILKHRVKNYSKATLLNYRSEVLKRLELFTENDFSKISVDWKPQFELFRKGVLKSFVDVSRDKLKTTNTNINKRQNEGIEIDVINLITWANDTLKNLPSDTARWREVAIALMIATGRRQSEIMSSAIFEAIDSYKIHFTGQLKRHIDDQVESFTIPTLVNSQLVVNGLKWLQTNGKRENNPKKAHNRFSRYLSETAKKTCDDYINLTQGNWNYIDDKGKEKDRRTCHIFRQIYGQIAYKTFCSNTRKISQFLTEIMGHSTSPSSRNWAATNYDSDITIVNSSSDLKYLILG
jgi:integrase